LRCHHRRWSAFVGFPLAPTPLERGEAVPAAAAATAQEDSMSALTALAAAPALALIAVIAFIALTMLALVPLIYIVVLKPDGTATTRSQRFEGAVTAVGMAIGASRRRGARRRRSGGQEAT